ncbi:hypothetical protein BH09BAC1_BH09BAC1_12490 [soil metagenome]
MGKLNLLFCVFLLMSCSHKHDKSNHVFTSQVLDGVYLETYNVFNSGAYGGDLYADYLTDSTTYRILFDTYDTGKERISYAVNGDTVLLSKYTRKSKRDKLHLEYTLKYTVMELQAIKKFE